MRYSRKKLKHGGGVGQVAAIIACQVPATSYQPVATNKPLLALFSLFASATRQLAQLQLAIAYSDIYLFICYLFTYLSIYLCIYSFIYLLFIYLFIYLHHVMTLSYCLDTILTNYLIMRFFKIKQNA